MSLSSFFENWVQESKRSAVEPSGFDLYISAPKYSCTMRSYFNKHGRKVFEVDSISDAEPKAHIRKSFDTKRRAKKHMNYQLSLLVWTKYENCLISSVDCPDEVPAGADGVDVELNWTADKRTTNVYLPNIVRLVTGEFPNLVAVGA